MLPDLLLLQRLGSAHQCFGGLGKPGPLPGAPACACSTEVDQPAAGAWLASPPPVSRAVHVHAAQRLISLLQVRGLLPPPVSPACVVGGACSTLAYKPATSAWLAAPVPASA